jgi:hypothetical protein
MVANMFRRLGCGLRTCLTCTIGVTLEVLSENDSLANNSFYVQQNYTLNLCASFQYSVFGILKATTLLPL